MKKAFNVFISVIFMLSIAVFTASSASAASSKKDSVYNFLTKDIGFNSAAACGIMANIEHESNFNPAKVGIDSNGLTSGGLCQWNGSRFSGLKKYCSKNGFDYLSVEGQLHYLEYELQQKSYKHIYNYLKSVENTADGAYDAAYYWCYYFEVPSNRSSRSVTRGKSAQSKYWKEYKTERLSDITLKCDSEGKTVDKSGTLTLKWNNTGSSTESYTVYIARKTNGVYNWDKAEKKVLSPKTRSYTVKLDKKKIGTYKVYVIAKSAAETKKSAVLKFSVDCLKHNYTSKVIKKATASASGTKKYTCQKCGYSYKNSYTKVESDAHIALRTIDLKVIGVSETKINLRCSSLNGADGIVLYRYDGKKWVKAATSNNKTISLTGLSAGKTYSLKFRTYSKSGSDMIYSKFTFLKVATAPKDTYFKSSVRLTVNKASLKWEKSDGASGYVIYVSTAKDGEYTKVKTITSGNTTSCKIDGLKPFTHYYFKISAYRTAENNTAYSQRSKAGYVI